MAASRKSKKFWIWLGVGLVVVLSAAGFGLVRMAKGSAIDPNRLAKVTRGDVARSVVATGKIQPITKVEVKSKASGIVEKLYVDINDAVKKGQQLAQLDQQEIQAQVEAQRAQLSSRRSQCDHLRGQHRAGQGECRSAGPADVQGHARPQPGDAEGRDRQPAGAGRRQQGLPGGAHPARLRPRRRSAWTPPS